MRYALGLEYDGADYSGWQTQKHRPSVQQAVESALSRVADHPVRVVCAGRTDAGVHAWAQVVHFDSDASRPLHGWLRGTNANLPDSVRVRWAHAVPDEFHARFSATRRSYRYLIVNRPSAGALGRGYAWFVRAPLDVTAMRSASQAFIGEHDFSAFRAASCQAHRPWRNIHTLEISRYGERIVIDIAANAFLQHMVRNIAGVLVHVGVSAQPARWCERLVACETPRAPAVTAPPQGLYLSAVEYPAGFGLPVTALVLPV